MPLDKCQREPRSYQDWREAKGYDLQQAAGKH